MQQFRGIRCHASPRVDRVHVRADVPQDPMYSNKLPSYNGHVRRLNLGSGVRQGSFHKLNALGK